MAYRVVESFSIGMKPARSRMLLEGDVVSEEDPAVKSHPKYFVPLEDHLRTVEFASANPGALRDVGVKIPAAKRGKK